MSQLLPLVQMLPAIQTQLAAVQTQVSALGEQQQRTQGATPAVEEEEGDHEPTVGAKKKKKKSGMVVVPDNRKPTKADITLLLDQLMDLLKVRSRTTETSRTKMLAHMDEELTVMVLSLDDGNEPEYEDDVQSVLQKLLRAANHIHKLAGPASGPVYNTVVAKAALCRGVTRKYLNKLRTTQKSHFCNKIFKDGCKAFGCSGLSLDALETKFEQLKTLVHNLPSAPNLQHSPLPLDSIICASDDAQHFFPPSCPTIKAYEYVADRLDIDEREDYADGFSPGLFSFVLLVLHYKFMISQPDGAETEDADEFKDFDKRTIGRMPSEATIDIELSEVFAWLVDPDMCPTEYEPLLEYQTMGTHGMDDDGNGDGNGNGA